MRIFHCVWRDEGVKVPHPRESWLPRNRVLESKCERKGDKLIAVLGKMSNCGTLYFFFIQQVFLDG